MGRRANVIQSCISNCMDGFIRDLEQQFVDLGTRRVFFYFFSLGRCSRGVDGLGCRLPVYP
jgi:hypothetical protein